MHVSIYSHANISPTLNLTIFSEQLCCSFNNKWHLISELLFSLTEKKSKIHSHFYDVGPIVLSKLLIKKGLLENEIRFIDLI